MNRHMNNCNLTIKEVWTYKINGWSGKGGVGSHDTVVYLNPSFAV